MGEPKRKKKDQAKTRDLLVTAGGFLAEYVAVRYDSIFLAYAAIPFIWYALHDLYAPYLRRKSWGPILTGFLGPLNATVLVLVVVWIRPTVSVEPKVVSFDKSIPRETMSFMVTNETSQRMYSVQVKLKISSPSQLGEFNIGLARDSRKPIIDGSEAADTFGVVCSDSNQNQLLMLVISRMESHETREIVLTHVINDVAAITGSIAYFTNIEQPRNGEINKLSGKMHADEPMQCNDGIAFAVDPDKPNFKASFDTTVYRASRGFGQSTILQLFRH